MYVIGNNDKYVLYDCLWHDSFSVIKSALKEHGIVFTQIMGLFISHFHPDHAGSFELLRQHGVAPIILDYQMPHIKWLNNFFAKPKNDPARQYIPIKTELIKPVTPDTAKETLRSCGIDGKILQTPGHSDDSISLIVGDSVFVGDLPRVETAVGFGGKAEASWCEISDYNISKIYYAHGNTYEDIAAIEKWKAEHLDD